MTARGRKARVDFVEAGEIHDDGGPPDDGRLADPAPGAVPDEPHGRRGWRRIKRAWPIALVAVVGVGLLLALDQRGRAAREAQQDLFATQWHRLAELGSGLGPAWLVEDVGRYPSVADVEDVYLVGVDTDDGAALIALEAESGAERWRIRDAGVHIYCESPARQQSSPPAGTAACTASTTDSWSLVLLDLATGEQRASRDMGGSAEAMHWHGAVLLVESDPDGTQLRLEDFDGTVRWAVPVLDRALSTYEVARLDVAGDRAMAVVGDRVVAVDVAGAVILDTDSPARPPAAPATSALVPLSPGVLPRGGFVLTGYDGTRWLTVVYDEHGEQRFEAEAGLGLSSFDDGSLGDVVVLWKEGGIEVRDLAGGVLAQLDGTSDGALYVVDGALVFTDAGRLRAFEAASGEERWSVDVGFGTQVGSDGSVVLVHGYQSADPMIRAFDVGTGAEEWVYELPGPRAEPLVAGGTLLIHDGTTLTKLAPSD